MRVRVGERGPELVFHWACAGRPQIRRVWITWSVVRNPTRPDSVSEEPTAVGRAWDSAAAQRGRGGRRPAGARRRRPSPHVVVSTHESVTAVSAAPPRPRRSGWP
eukprot:2611369-Prymnesium_polylepis.2